MAKKLTSENLTVDYRTIMSMPPSTRRQLMATGSIDPLLGVLTPGQRVALFPDYFKQSISGMAGQRSEFSVNSPRTGPQVELPSSSLPEPLAARVQSPPGTTKANAPTTTLPVGAQPSKSGTYRPAYAGIQNDLQDPDLINIIAREARRTNESIDAVINNMMNRLGSKSYGSPASLSEVAKQGGQYESWNFLQSGRFKPVDKEHAAQIAERLSLVASGQVPDTTGGANEFRARSYLEGEGAGKTFYRTATSQGFRDVGGNVYANTGYEVGPYAAFSQEQVAQNLEAQKNENPNAMPLATVADDAESVTGENASAVPEAVMRTGGIPYPAAMSAVDRALSAQGLNERENVELLKKYLQGQKISDLESQAWCAAFVNASLASAGLQGSGSNLANSFQTYGTGVDDYKQTMKGDIVVNTRGGGPNDRNGHVMMATGNTRINPDTGTFEVEIVGGNEADAVRTRYVNPEGFMVRRAVEANLANPPPSNQVAAVQTVAQPTASQTDETAPQTDETATPVQEPSTLGADLAVSAAGMATGLGPGIAGGVAHIMDTDTSKAGNSSFGDWVNKNIPGAKWIDNKIYDMSGGFVGTSANDPRLTSNTAPQLAKVANDTAPIGVPTSSMAYGGVLKEPHTAVNNRTGERVNLGEVGTGGEAIVPMSKVRANEVGQQPYQMPQAPQPDARMPKQVDIDRKEPMSKNATGQMPTPSMPIMVDHQIIPPSARKAYADAGLEGRFNNFSSIGTQYRSFGI